jgi:hypothetical protein
MTEFNWKVLQTTSLGDNLVSVNYLVTAAEGDNQVQSEGHADVEGKISVPYAEIRENHVLDCLREMYLQDEPKSLKSRLQEQLDYLKSEAHNDLPWKDQIFSVKL